MPRHANTACLLAVATWLLVAPAAADDAEVARRRDAGAKALTAGEPLEARHHLLRALALSPGAPDVVDDLLALDADDPEAQALWALHAALAAADANGRFNPPRSWPKSMATDAAFARDVAKAHGKALKAALSALARVKGARGHVDWLWLTGVARELTIGAPGMAAGSEDAITKAATRTEPRADLVLAALLDLVGKARGRGDLDTALDAARTVRGLHQQANQTKTSGAAPSGAGARAVRAIADIRRELRAREDAAREAAASEGAEQPKEPPVWSVPTLEAIPDDEIDAWNARHAKWARAGVALSPGERYRVETICGMVTLLTVTKDVEAHHARLVRWFGQDPFLKRQGLVRLSPDYRDFESEGQPFWWAGGFQSGDVTTMIARFPTRRGLGGTLVHELNHRFDGAVYPGISAWLSEGRAMYVESGSLVPDAEEVDENVTSWNRLWETNSHAYGSPDGLRKLLSGDIPDYRHNYDAGYSLVCFLNRFSDFSAEQLGEPLLRTQIEKYLKSFRAKPRSDPVKRFETHFCDGKDGRPATLAAFAALFRQWLREGGSGATPSAPWKATWQKRARVAMKTARTNAGSSRRIFDRATFQARRTRHDIPDEGQYHARVAADLLLAAGKRDAALEAIHWALRADDPIASSFVRAAEMSEKANDAKGAWVVRMLAHHLDPSRNAAPSGQGAGPIAAAWRAAADVARRYHDASKVAEAAGRRRLARALRAEHDRLVHWLGVDPLGPMAAAEAVTEAGGESPAAKAESAAKTARSPHAPELPPFVGILGRGAAETFWAPLESAPGPWHQPQDDQLELGRSKAGKERSGAIRNASERHIFVETPAFHQGAYSIRTRVRYLSAFAAGELVIGKTHRDRGLRIRFRGGDWGYAVGNRDKGTPLRQIRLSVSDLRPWGGRTGALSETVNFPSPRDVFELEARVVGSHVTVLVNGEVRVSYRRPTSAPIEGTVGFGLSRGIVRFEEPEVRRHRILGPDALTPEGALDAPLDPSRRGFFPWATIVGRRLVGVPVHKGGTLVFWYPDGTSPNQMSNMAVGAAVESFLRWFGPARDDLAVRVFVPASVKPGSDILKDPQAAHADIDSLVNHRGHADLAGAIRAVAEEQDGSVVYRGYQNIPVWIMVDDRGVIRSAAPADPVGPAVNLARSLAGW